MTAFDEAAARVAAGGDAVAEARGLVAQMDLAEKLWCLDGDTPFWPGVVDMRSGGYHAHPFPAAKIPRLGIPGLDFADGPRGCVIGPCTAFPVSMARGASFDPDLERRIGAAIGAELRAQGATFTGAVCLNLLRHPAWGRAQETYGEDPHHVGAMAAALTEGLQQHVMACMKHFALNSMENARFRVDVTVDERALHEVYLPHFKRVADAGVASVMSAYNSVNGAWCGENAPLLTGVLREDWGFAGFVITDFNFGLRDPVGSVAAGCNVEMPFRQQRAVALASAVAAGALSVADVEDRVAETVATFLRFAHVYAEPPPRQVIACAEHRALAREAASASMVLLRNDGALLPLDPAAVRRVAVLGRLADRPNLGDGGSSDVLQPEVVTPLAGLRAALPAAEVVHSEADVAVARDADVVVVVVGYTKEDEGEYIDPAAFQALAGLFPPIDHPEVGMPANPTPVEGTSESAGPAQDEPAAGSNGDAGGPPAFAAGGDRISLRLHPRDEALIRAAAAAHDRVVVAVIAGSAVVMPWLDDVPATLLQWYAGMEGGHALADVLLGAAEPGGRLPFAIPRDESHLVHFDRDASRETYGLLHGQWWLDHRGLEAQRPFGFGLGYTPLALDDARIEGDRASVTVHNRGARDGSTVVQLYGSVPESAFERPPRRLVGFARVRLAAGASQRVEIDVDRAALDVRQDGQWIREARPVAFAIGFDAATARPIASDPSTSG